MSRGIRSFFLLSRLNSNAKARTLIPGFKPVHDALQKAADGKRNADNDELFARGPVIEMREIVAVFITVFQLDLLKVVAKNYDDPLYKAMLPKGLTEFRKLSGQALADELARIILRLQELDKTHPLVAHLPELQKLVKDFAVPLKDHKAAVAAQVAADVVALNARAVWRVEYDAIAGSLRKMFPGRKSYQESFFYAEAAQRAKKSEPETGGTQG